MLCCVHKIILTRCYAGYAVEWLFLLFWWNVNKTHQTDEAKAKWKITAYSKTRNGKYSQLVVIDHFMPSKRWKNCTWHGEGIVQIPRTWCHTYVDVQLLGSSTRARRMLQFLNTTCHAKRIISTPFSMASNSLFLLFYFFLFFLDVWQERSAFSELLRDDQKRMTWHHGATFAKTRRVSQPSSFSTLAGRPSHKADSRHKDGKLTLLLRLFLKVLDGKARVVYKSHSLVTGTRMIKEFHTN